MKIMEKISSSTVFSFHMVTVICGLVVWGIRLSDKVELHEQRIKTLEANNKNLKKMRSQLYRIGDHFGIKRPKPDDNDDKDDE